MIEISEQDIIEVRIERERYKITAWEALIDNSEGSYTGKFEASKEVEIYLGIGDSEFLVLEGILYDVQEEEDAILLRGFDYADALIGPMVDKEYWETDWGLMLKDLLLSYTKLEPRIEAVGASCEGRLVFRNTPLYDTVLFILDQIPYFLDICKEGSSWVATLVKRSYAPKYELTEADFIDASLKTTASQIVNQVIVVGENERIRDHFDTPTFKADYWQMWSEGWSMGFPDYNLTYSGTTVGEVYSKFPFYNGTLTVPIMVNTTAWDTSIYFRVALGNKNIGYRLRIWVDGTTSKVSLYKDGTTLLTSANISALEAGKWYVLELRFDPTNIKVFWNKALVINLDEWTYTSGYLCLAPQANAVTKYDYLDLETDTKCYAIAEDAESIAKYGIKSITLNRPEINTREEAKRVAELELQNRLLQCTELTLTLEGTTALNVNDVITFNAPEYPYLDGKDFLITNITQRYEEQDWITELGLIELKPGTENLLRAMRGELLKRVTPPGIPTKLGVSDLLTAPLDSVFILPEGYNQIGGQIGVWKV